MNYIVILNCSWNVAAATVSNGKIPVYYSDSKLKSSFHKEENKQIASNLAKKCIDYLLANGITEVPMIIKGPQGDVRMSFIHEFMNSGIKLMYINDVTPIPHNICKPPKIGPSKMKSLAIGKQ